MARGVWTTPWQYSTADHQGRRIEVSVAFNSSTLAIVNPGLTGTREAGCLYDRVVIGRASNGTQRVIGIPEGAFTVSRQTLAAAGFSTISDITNNGFTLGTLEPVT